MIDIGGVVGIVSLVIASIGCVLAIIGIWKARQIGSPATLEAIRRSGEEACERIRADGAKTIEAIQQSGEEARERIRADGEAVRRRITEGP